jgi:drug/metabolite transporter (DMT)-like permease
LAPFIVAYISRIFLKETLPPKTKPALLLCFLGSLFMILGGQAEVQAKDRLSNWLGIGLSLLAGVFLAVLMLEIKRLSRKGAPAYTTIQASRLVSAILFSWLILGEGIQSLAQALGALIVIATITWYTLRICLTHMFHYENILKQ